MARSYSTTGIELNPSGDFRIHHNIRESGSSPDHGGLDRVAKNANSTYAGWSPTLASLHCSDASGEDCLTLTSTSTTEVYALRFRVPGDIGGQVPKLGFSAYCKANTAAGTLTLATKNGASTGSITIPVSSSYAWVDVSSGVSAGTSGSDPDHEIAVIKGNKTTGGLPYVRSLHVHYLPETGGSGELTSGEFSTGFTAQDLARWDADSPLSVGALRSLEDAHEVTRGLPWPVGCRVADLRTSLGKSQGMWTDSDGPTEVVRIPYWRRKGEGVETLAYSLFGMASYAGGSATVYARYQGRTVGTSNTHTLSTGSPDVNVYSDWHDGTLDISQVPEGHSEPIWIVAYVSCTTAGDDAAIYSFCCQEDPH